MSRAVSVTGPTIVYHSRSGRSVAHRTRGGAQPWQNARLGPLPRSCGRLVVALALGLSLSGLPADGVALAATETEALREALESEKQRAAALEAELAKTRSEMQARIDKAQDELSARLEELFASVTWKSDPEVAVLRRKLEAAGAEIAGLTAARENSRAYSTRLETRLKSVNQKVEGLEQVASAEAAAFRKQLAVSEDEIDRLEAAVAEVEAARVLTAEQVEAARAKQDVWASRVVEANDAAFKAAAGAQALRETLDGLRKELDEVGGERDALQRELDEARSEIGKRIERVFAAASSEAGAEVDSLRKELDASRKEKASLEAAKRDAGREAEALRQKLAALEAEARALEAAAAKAEAAQARAEARLRDAEGGQQGRLQELEKTTAALSEEAVGLRKDIEATKRQAAALAAERDAAKQEIAEVAGVLLTTQKQAEGLQDALSRSLAARKQIGEQLEAALARVEAQGEALAAVEASAQESAVLRKELADSKQELSRIREELVRTQAEVEAARGEIAQRIGKLFAVAAEEGPGSDVMQLKEKLAAARQEIARLNAALKERGDAGAVDN